MSGQFRSDCPERPLGRRRWPCVVESRWTTAYHRGADRDMTSPESRWLAPLDFRNRNIMRIITDFVTIMGQCIILWATVLLRPAGRRCSRPRLFAAAVGGGDKAHANASCGRWRRQVDAGYYLSPTPIRPMCQRGASHCCSQPAEENMEDVAHLARGCTLIQLLSSNT